jgi:hypothetical protein
VSLQKLHSYIVQGVGSDGSRIEGEISFNASEEVAVTDVPVQA